MIGNSLRFYGLLQVNETNKILKETEKECRDKTQVLSAGKIKKSQFVEEMVGLQLVHEELSKKLVCCVAERDVMSKHFEGECSSLRPRFIATAVDLRQQLYKMSPCAVCLFGYHCNNFIPTSCGHTYHPACIMPLISRQDTGTPRCVACNEIFHPDWLASWGLARPSSEVDKFAAVLDLDAQSQSFETAMRDLYREGAVNLKARREKERRKQRLLTQKYSKVCLLHYMYLRSFSIDCIATWVSWLIVFCSCGRMMEIV